MSRKLLAFLLAELSTVRIVCQACKAATELTVVQLGARNHHTCPACRTPMDGAAAGMLQELAKHVEFLQKCQGFDVEFVLADDGSID